MSEHCLYEHRWGTIEASLRQVSAQLTRIERKQDVTNGRVTRLERAALLLAGALAGVSIAYGGRMAWLEQAIELMGAR